MIDHECKCQTTERNLSDKAYDLLAELYEEKEIKALLCEYDKDIALGDTSEMSIFFVNHEGRHFRQIDYYCRRRKTSVFFKHTLPKAAQIAASCDCFKSYSSSACIAVACEYRRRIY